MQNVLIAEDETKLREIVVKYLKKEGYNVFEAEDGEKALEVFKDNPLDLVILDVMMPNVDGCPAAGRSGRPPTCPSSC